MAEPEREQRPLLEVEQSVTSIPEDHEATCWGCGLRLVFTSYSPIYKCGWWWGLGGISYCFQNQQLLWHLSLHGSAFFLSARGLVLVYLAFASLSVNAGIGVLLCQQLSYIYEGNTYLNHLSSPNPLHGERGLQNIVRFFGCPYPISRVLLRYSNTGKLQDNSGSKLL
ncbi:unnamed protein product [Miscanthus lutarioriparius]|uniref:Uncharacterized protein n=1 Tax=Miscanthus lutarioriparius TaxID=422564 RepID=A0A811QZP3_9POAL|nr:unnamed protein product [Miscanthus lutarioriparius]